MADVETLLTICRHFHPTDKGFRWDAVPLKHYKPEGTHFRDITRQVLFGPESGLPAELRYFEVAPGGYSTFERHAHVHAVLILRGRGRAIVGEQVFEVAPFDLIHVPAWTWHQFQAPDDEALGFLCLVATDRDRPVRPTPEEAAQLRQHPVIGPYVRL
ncbi:cupin domain-containing protein [Rhodothermus profundi]|uniref:Cupin domain protein n=1 Tax=Rhodothermus profundi TaxID=633813 RepID=A0A1M6PDN2_9BACT|nr:cupin domain-containing protein [Rhodothermus profundi]SHK05992.1 Cupin domain protein [Rhodothermus profundi]